VVKSRLKTWATPVICKEKLHKVNSRPTGENSPNLGTLTGSIQLSLENNSIAIPITNLHPGDSNPLSSALHHFKMTKKSAN
jgi:hypothetical protein